MDGLRRWPILRRIVEWPGFVSNCRYYAAKHNVRWIPHPTGIRAMVKHNYKPSMGARDRNSPGVAMNEDAELDFFYSVLANQPITKSYAAQIREHAFGDAFGAFETYGAECA